MRVRTEADRARDRAYHATHPRTETDRARDRAYHAANRDKRNAYVRAYRREHLAEAVENQRKWRVKNPGKSRAMRAADNAVRKFGEAVHWTVFLRLHLWPCIECGVTPANGVDHIVPFIQGGRNVVENLRSMCLSCNTRKAQSDGRRVAA